MYKLWVKFLSVTVWPVQDMISKIMSILVIKALAKGGFDYTKRRQIRIAAETQMWPDSWWKKQMWGLGILFHYGLPTFRWWRDN